MSKNIYIWNYTIWRLKDQYLENQQPGFHFEVNHNSLNRLLRIQQNFY